MGTSPSRPGAPSITLGDVDRWVLEALTGFEGHRGRWLHRRLTGLSDAKLVEAIRFEFGDEWGRGGLDGPRRTARGLTSPFLHIGDHFHPLRIVRGKELLAITRRLMGVGGLKPELARGAVPPEPCSNAVGAIPDASEEPMLSDLTRTDEYLERYSKYLGRKTVADDRPLFVPGEDPYLPLTGIARPPKGAQVNVVNAMARALDELRALIVCGEMGTGKTYMGTVGIHLHARDRPYRACIMAPNHLIDKWAEEIEMTIPGAVVKTFEKSDDSTSDDSYRAVLAYAAECRGEPQVVHKRGKRQELAKWSVPERPEWVIIGRNQAKWEPGWEPIGTRPWVYNPGTRRRKVFGKRKPGEPVQPSSFLVCPNCGQPVRDPSGLIADPRHFDGQHVCEELYLREVHEDGREPTGLDVVCPIPLDHARRKPGDHVRQDGRLYEVVQCGEHLWYWTPRPRKWAPAKIIQAKMANLFDYFVLDEMHEEKSATSAQALAACKIMAASRKIVGLTGTLIGGYAHHLFPLLMRMAPASLIEEGFGWHSVDRFNQEYGRIDTTYTDKFGGEEKKSKGGKKRGSTSMRKESGDEGVESVKPGVVPTLFGRHLVDKSIFVSLSEMGDELPVIMDDDRSLIACDMDEPLASEYRRVLGRLIEKNQELVQKGSRKLLSAMHHTLIGYPDRPYGWEAPAVVRAIRPDAPAVGYYDGNEPGEPDPRTWFGVVQPAELDQSHLYPKEAALFDLCYREAVEGRQTWVYVMQTGKRDIQGRLQKILQNGGLKAKVLRQSTCEPRDRWPWIKENGPKNHVIISHPQLVSTGLDFFDKKGSFNFCTIVFYQSTYDVNLMRQAGRRHWRIGQPKECRNFYLYYKGTMQLQQVKHIGEKYAAAKSLEGKFSAEGLAAMAEGGVGMTEMAKALEKHLDDPRAAWGKLRADDAAKAQAELLSFSDDDLALLDFDPEIRLDRDDLDLLSFDPVLSI